MKDNTCMLLQIIQIFLISIVLVLIIVSISRIHPEEHETINRICNEDEKRMKNEFEEDLQLYPDRQFELPLTR